ncbi:helix-turn-helix transcriptional regulator [Proteiniborus sp. MB09-C3]|uniref:helix-turn-helix domain-containing protein n=1 Tax=Proteiniborus sp. MB09-C3 TaxID=3050072 RepID=UPI0025535502|nr:helix-turn-helix transcriptional regulator [Proteiniborus sp. MB09-C3]WIV11381.1 helix-turn-helix transcriptional regulator [Proteiniborus sp. MB09-C3]
MKKAKVLKKLIEDTGSIKAFAEKADIPYTTLYSILERGVGKASVDNVIKICKTLGITVEEMEEMAKGEIMEKNKPATIAAHLDKVKLTEEEEKQLNDYIQFLLSRRKK